MFQNVLLFLLLSTQIVSAIDIKSIGVPYVQNYTKTAYQSGNQNWAVARGADGVMYFGNSNGLLAFDGKYWQLFKMPNNIIVRSVAADGKGKIYVGGFSEIGYWSYDDKGKFRYKSLISLIPKEQALQEEVWKIYVDDDRVIFQSFSTIFIYQNGKMTPVKAEEPFLFLFKASGRYFVEVLSKGLYELKGNKLTFIANNSILGNTGILSILPFGKGQFLIGTAKNGVFLYDGKQIAPWLNGANALLKANQLNNGCLVLNKYYAYGTILNGIFILDKEGKLVQHINKLSGLQNNTVLSLFTDEDQNLWSGLDNGVDRIDVNSPLYFYLDKTGKFGTVYSSIIHNNKIYLGTNQGLFYSAWSSENLFQSFDFKLIEGSQGQVWDLSLIDNQILCGHNAGTFRVEDNKLNKISDFSGGWIIKKLYSHADILIQGTYNGLVLYKKEGSGKWLFWQKVEGFSEPSRYIEQDEKGNVWVSHAYKGLYKLTLSTDLKKVITVKEYGTQEGLPGKYKINVFKLDGRIIFSSDKGFYYFDDLNDRFFKYSQLNQKLGAFAFSNKIIKASDNKYWFIDHGRVGLVDISEKGKLKIDSSHFSILSGRMVQSYENISRISKGIFLISVDDGFVIFNDQNLSSQGRGTLPNVLIRKVENSSEKGQLLRQTANSTNPVEILADENNIRIAYALPYYSQTSVKYQYYLDGYSKNWSEWSTEAQKEFSNLAPGNYLFKVRAKVGMGQVSADTYFAFTVLPPWYLSKWASLVYLALAAIIFVMLKKLYQLKLEKHQEEINRKLQEEKEESLRKQEIENKQKIVKLKNEQLEADLMNKSRELASSAMNIVYKNELLQKINTGLYELRDSNGKKLASEQLRKIQKIIDEGMNDERDWNIFEKSFNDTHESFFKKLKSRYPDLVPNDLKLCAYLRMNMSSKEMASLLNISLRGVEIRRYRLRKKLELSHDKNLVEFLMEL